VDQQIAGWAERRQAGRRPGDLESNCSLFKELDADAAAAAAEDAGGVPRMDAKAEALVARWRAGDSTRWQRISGGGFRGFEALRGRIVTDRNRAWLPAIEALLERGPGTSLVVVGACTSSARTACPRCWQNACRPRSDLDHLEVFLAGAAVRAAPAQRHVVPPGAGRNSAFRIALGLLVHVPADHAHPSFHRWPAAAIIEQPRILSRRRSRPKPDVCDPPTVLVVAGNDPSGGAGIAADLQAITAAGGHPAPVITALTVQDTVNATAVEPVAPAWSRPDAGRARRHPVAAVKIGLLATAAIAAAVADVLAGVPGCRWCSIRCWSRPAARARGGRAGRVSSSGCVP
jgi:hypothetical protein